MEIEAFLKKITAYQAKELPFVVYRKPHQNSIKGFFQNDRDVYTTDKYTKEGFVFAPFDSSHQTVFFPSEKCDFLESHQPLSSKNEVVENSTTVVESVADKQYHIALVNKGVETIRAEIFQKVVLSRQLSIRKREPVSSEEIISLFKKLEALYPTAFVYCWFHPNIGLWLGATPERLVSIVDNTIKTMALAGTQKYAEKDTIVWDEKERKEQQLVTDFIVNALQSVSSDISVSKTVNHRAGQLVHLKNDITAVLSKNKTIKNIVDQLHPTPAVCGLPKEKTQQFILNHEGYKRSFYTGFLGECNMSDSKSDALKTDFYVNLRCMNIDRNTIYIYVGGGITKDSNAELEWQETVNKAQTMLAVL